MEGDSGIVARGYGTACRIESRVRAEEEEKEEEKVAAAVAYAAEVHITDDSLAISETQLQLLHQLQQAAAPSILAAAIVAAADGGATRVEATKTATEPKKLNPSAGLGSFLAAAGACYFIFIDHVTEYFTYLMEIYL